MGEITIEGRQMTLAKVFGDEFVFRIPNYQRPYAWGTQQTEELLDDLTAALGEDEKTSPDNLPPYFLGSIVLIQPKGHRDADVVDGQQRITTLTLLFAALQHTLVDQRHKDSMRRRLFQEGDVGEGLADSPRLTLRTKDLNFFREYVQDEGGIAKLLAMQTEPDTESQEHLRENAVILVKKLSALGEPRRQQLVRFLLQRCVLVVVTTGDRESAVRIFTVLNSRGLDLEVSDILKSELIDDLKLDAAAQNELTGIWEEAEAQLGREIFQEFFAHVRMIHQTRVSPFWS